MDSNTLKTGATYHWSEDQTFELTSKEFSNLLNSLNAIVGNPLYTKLMEDAQQKVYEGSQIIAVSKLQELMTGVLARSVEQGIASEQVTAPAATA